MEAFLLVEGKTEVLFVREMLCPCYKNLGLYIKTRMLETSPGHFGGATTYAKIKYEIDRLCKRHSKAYVSTMFDLYAFPNIPELELSQQKTGQQKAEIIEKYMAQDIKHRNFIPNIMVHEFEALLFVRPECFSGRASPEAIESLQAIRKKLKPEEINDSKETAPSKRIQAIVPRYDKAAHGVLIARDIGLPAMRKSCPHFNGWLCKLDALAPKSAQ